HRSEQRFRALIENSSDAIALLNAEGIIIYASTSTIRVLGYTPAEFMGLGASALIHPAEWKRTQEIVCDLIAQPGHEITLETRVRHKDGSWCWVEGIVRNALFDAAIEAMVVNYRDMSERRKLEEQFLQAQKME